MTLYHILLGLHITGGFTALLAGAIDIINKKGGNLHIKTGNIFFWAMLIVAFSAISLSFMKDNCFLLHIGIFTLYMNVAGKRSIVEKSLKPKIWEIILLLAAILNGVWMIASLEIILIVFGSISIILNSRDIWIYYTIWQQKKLPKNAWLRRHVGMMLGTYLSTFTAFLVVNINLGTYNWLVWLLPTFLITPLIIYWVKRVTNFKFQTGIVVALLFISTASLSAQIFIEKQTRHRFAQLTLGTSVQSSFGGRTSILNAIQQIEKLDLPNMIRPRFIVGGTHFWGHADIYVSFPLSYPTVEKRNYEFSYGSTVETVFKYYPWRITSGKIRPYIGTGLASYSFTQNSQSEEQLANGVDIDLARAPLYLGFTFNKSNHLFEANLTYNYAGKKDYYISPTQQTEIKMSPLFLALSYKYMLDTTVGAEKDWENGKTQEITKKLGDTGRLNHFFIGIGASTSATVRRSSYNEADRPYFGTPSTNTFLDLSAGYHFHNLDMNIAVSWRKFEGSNRAFQIEQLSRRNSFGLEITKNLGDYHGFVPFIGPCLSYERLSFQESFQGNNILNTQQNKPALGIVFGWDILPNRLQSFVLRTNLRYFPNLNLDLSDNKKIAYDNIEFNFIQLVVYPERIFGKW